MGAPKAKDRTDRPLPAWAWVAIVGIVAAAVLLGIALVGHNQKTASDFETVYLDPDKKVSVLVLRDLDRVFPVFARDFKAEFDLAQQNKGAVEKGTADTAFEAKAHKLYKELDEINKDLRDVLVASYTKYVTAVGSSATTPQEREAAGKSFDEAVKRAIDMATTLRKIRKQLEDIKTNTSPADWDLTDPLLAELKRQLPAKPDAK